MAKVNNFRERLKEHDWKSCVRPQRCTGGSNPPLSAINRQVIRRSNGRIIEIIF